MWFIVHCYKSEKHNLYLVVYLNIMVQLGYVVTATRLASWEYHTHILQAWENQT